MPGSILFGFSLPVLGDRQILFAQLWSNLRPSQKRAIVLHFYALKRMGVFSPHLLLRDYISSRFCDHIIAVRSIEIMAHLRERNSFGTRYEDPLACYHEQFLKDVSDSHLKACAELQDMCLSPNAEKHRDVFLNFAQFVFKDMQEQQVVASASSCSEFVTPDAAVWCAWTIGSKPCLQLLQLVSPPVVAFATSDVTSSYEEDAACYD
jgi:hypothetical protein